MNHGNNRKFAPGPIIQTLCAHSTPKDTALFTVLFAWHGHCLLEASRLTYVARRNTKYTQMHAHTHTHAHTPTYKHRGTHIPQELIWILLGLAMVGAEKRSLLLLLGSSALADPDCFADFTMGECGLGAS